MTRRRKQKLPPEPIEATVTRLSHDGRGIAEIDGKTTFIDGALPDETVMFTYIRKKGSFDEGRIHSVITPSTQRIQPTCTAFNICGGCSLQHMSSDIQIQLKQTTLLDQLHHFAGIQPETILPPLTGSPWGYRRKARLGVRHVEKKGSVLIGFREKYNPRFLADINECPILDPRVGLLITPLRSLFATLETHKDIPQIEVAIDDKTTALIIRHLTALSAADRLKFQTFAEQHQLRLYLQPEGIDSIHLFYPTDAPTHLEYTLANTNITLQFHPNDFTQINADINAKMVSRALELLAPEPHDHILDLFCGLGNFSLPLAKQCQQVVGVEGSQAMVTRATANARLNGITNAQFYCADLSSNLEKQSWLHEKFAKIVIDPPRTGALEIIAFLPQWNAERILYVSCNPATLARDAADIIRQGYQLKQAGVMDMFPHTRHVESIALFEK